MQKYVNVIIDRPIGFKDTFGNVYPVNYGYVPGVIGGDGEAQDVYVLGYDRPLEAYYGKVIAIVEREDDVETKWVVAEKDYSIEEIYAQIQFIEKYFKSTVKLIK